jgi:S1-C subfamily serine protease
MRAGIKEGDAIVAVGFSAVVTRDEMYRELWKHMAGAVIRLGVLRGTERLVIEVTSVDRAEFYR